VRDYRAAVTSRTQTLRLDWAYATPICGQAPADSLCVILLGSVRHDAQVALDDLALITVPATLIRGDLHLRSALHALAAANTKADAENAWAVLSLAFDEVGAKQREDHGSDIPREVR